MALVSLVLAYAPGRPEGDVADRLDITLPLSGTGQPEDSATGPFAAQRTLPDGRQRAMELLRDDGAWALRRTGPAEDADDAPLWQVEVGVFRPGELVLLRRPDGEAMTFRIVNVAGE